MLTHNLLTETLISLPELAKRIPPYRGERTNSSTIGRWALKGCRDSNGERVKLGVVRIGGRFLTSLEEFARFTERLSAGRTLDADSPETITARNAAASQRASHAALNRLKARGVSITTNSPNQEGR